MKVDIIQLTYLVNHSCFFYMLHSLNLYDYAHSKVFIIFGVAKNNI